MAVLTAISLCSGYEGIGLGLKRAIPNLRTICYVEGETYAVANLVAKIKEGKLDDAPIWDDIKTFDPKPFAGLVDIIHSGYPCQPFSCAGKQKGTKDERHLWPFIADIVGKVRPTLCFFENVAGHLSIGFDTVVRDLDGLGYAVEAGLFTAAEVGAPHRRERLFILAHSEHNGLFTRKGPGSISPSICNTEEGKNHASNSKRTSSPRQLEYPLSEQRGLHTEGWDDNPETRPAGETMADDNNGQSNAAIITEPVKTTQLESGNDSGKRGKLADSNSTGREKQRRPEPIQQEQRPPECSGTRYPARPGQEQYEWEEPRTVKPRLGRAANGPKKRVDRLRLLGNGVVPAQAELAFRTLIEKF